MKIGVLGAGVMGAGIAQVTATAGYETVCYDVDAGALARGLEHVTTGRYGFARGVERGKLTQDAADAARARLSFTSSFDAAADVDLVVEAVPEKLELKQQVFRDLDAASPAGTILASNTSGFPIGQLAEVTKRPDLVIGWHWASPPAVMRLAEIVRTGATSDATVQTVVDVATACGKNPVVITDAPSGAWGFVANRVYMAMIQEANRCVDEGIATREQVDMLMVDCFRWPVGPFGMVQGATTGWGQ
jgi:3-hydroxyacyl-CoA dehydrogenase